MPGHVCIYVCVVAVKTKPLKELNHGGFVINHNHNGTANTE